MSDMKRRTERLEAACDIRLIVCDLSASPHIDLAGSRMLRQLYLDLARRGVALRIVGRVDGCATCCDKAQVSGLEGNDGGLQAIRWRQGTHRGSRYCRTSAVLPRCLQLNATFLRASRLSF